MPLLSFEPYAVRFRKTGNLIVMTPQAGVVVMMLECFFDTNTLVYLLSTDEPAKAARSEELFRKGGLISVQILNEILTVTRRKLKMPFCDVRTFVTKVRTICPVVPLTLEIHERGFDIAEAHGIGVYDSMVVAAAQLSGCSTLYSEDMQNGRVIGGLTIRNPYKP